MNPETAGTEEQGPSRVPYVNDPAKNTSRSPDDETERADEEEEEDGLQD